MAMQPTLDCYHVQVLVGKMKAMAVDAMPPGLALSSI